MAQEQHDEKFAGWDAITAACAALYPGQEPLHWGATVSRRDGGKEPLDGISVYQNSGPPPHWHLITYGMSDLYGSNSPRHENSGHGFEFTFRLLRPGTDAKPPLWALNLLQNLARYVNKTGNAFGHGHHIDLNGPIAMDAETEIRALAMIRDRQLQPIDTPSGKVTFLQLVGLTYDEYQAARAWKTEGIVDLLLETNPLLVTDLARKSILENAQTARLVAEKTTAEGSTMEQLLIESLDWDLSGVFSKSLRITLGANAVAPFQKSLVGRLLHDRQLTLRSAKKEIVFRPGAQLEWQIDGSTINLQVPPSFVQGFVQSIQARRGEYSVPEMNKLRVRVVPTEIKDANGKILRVIGG